MADDSLLEEFLARKPFRKALLGAGEKAVERAVEVPIKTAGDLVADRAAAFLDRWRRR